MLLVMKHCMRSRTSFMTGSEMKFRNERNEMKANLISRGPLSRHNWALLQAALPDLPLWRIDAGRAGSHPRPAKTGNRLRLVCSLTTTSEFIA